jgi:hypothetical protein
MAELGSTTHVLATLTGLGAFVEPGPNDVPKHEHEAPQAEPEHEAEA